jgi:hypothetical protein
VDPPEARNQAPALRSDVRQLTVPVTGAFSRARQSVRRPKLLTKAKDDILMQPRRTEETRLTAKEMRRAKKWRDMAIIDRPNGSIHYTFPMTKKVVVCV